MSGGTATCHWCKEKPVRAVATSQTVTLPTPFQGMSSYSRTVVVRACATHQARLVTLDTKKHA